MLINILIVNINKAITSVRYLKTYLVYRKITNSFIKINIA